MNRFQARRPRIRFLLVALATTVSACAAPDDPIPVAVADEAGLLDDAERAAVAAVAFPPGVRVLLRTVPSLPRTPGLPALASEAMEDDPHWQQVDPRNALSRWVDAAPPRAVFVLVSAKPRQVQARFGRSLAIPALQEGVHSGPAYRAWQDAYAAGRPDALAAGLADLSAALARGLDVPWYIDWMARGDIGGFVLDVLDDWLAPGDGPFTRWVLRPAAWTVSALAGLVAPLGAWAVLVAVGLAGFVLESIGRAAARRLSRRLIRHRLAHAAVRGANWAWRTAVTTAFGAALLLVASGRWEDHAALQAMGIAVPEAAVQSLAGLAAPTALWVAALVWLATIFVGGGENERDAMRRLAALPDEDQRRLLAAMPPAARDAFRFEAKSGFLQALADGDDADDADDDAFATRPFTTVAEVREGDTASAPFKWLFALLFLPGFVGVYVLVGQVLRIPPAVRRNARADRAVVRLLKAAGLEEASAVVHKDEHKPEDKVAAEAKAVIDDPA